MSDSVPVISLMVYARRKDKFFCCKLQLKVSKLKLKAHLLLCPSITIRFGSCRVPDPLLICRSSFCLPKSNCSLPICVLQLQVNGAGHQHLCHLFPLPLRWSGQITTYGSGIAPPNPNFELTTPQHRNTVRHLTLKILFIDGRSDAKDISQMICR